MRSSIETLVSRQKQLARSHAQLVIRKGRSSVVWGKGVVGWGGIMFIVLNAVRFYRQPQEWREPGEVLWLLFFLFDCAFFGYLSGLWLWKVYRKLSDLSD